MAANHYLTKVKDKSAKPWNCFIQDFLYRTDSFSRSVLTMLVKCGGEKARRRKLQVAEFSGVTPRRRKRQLEMSEDRYHTRCFSRTVESMHGQENRTRY